MAPKNLSDIEQKLDKAIRAVRRKRYAPARTLLADVVAADPQNENAWSWLARASEDPAKRTECLQRVLAINPDNQWAAGELNKQPVATATSERPSASADTNQPASSDLNPSVFNQSSLQLKSLACPNCGASCSLKGGAATRAMICPYCSSQIDLTNDDPTVIDSKKRRMKPGQPIEPGMEARFDGRLYQVIGWLRYEGWDDEDKWRWDEWQMISEDGDIRWLSYDDEAGFALGREIQPTEAFDPGKASKIPVLGGSVRVKERYPAKVIGLAGELTWRAKIGNRIQVAEGTHGNSSYTLEYVPNERLELYASQKQKARGIWEAFGRTDLLQESEGLAGQKARRKLLAFLCAAFALVSLLAAPILSAAGETVSSGRVTLQTGPENFREMEPFVIENAGRATKIDIKSSPLPTNSWAVVDISIYDDEDGEHYLTSVEFWDEEGRDSDGPWHESDLSGYTLFRAASPGTYQLELVMEESSANVSSIVVDVTITHKVWMVRYLIFAALVAALAACYFIWNIGNKMSSSSNARLLD